MVIQSKWLNLKDNYCYFTVANPICLPLWKYYLSNSVSAASLKVDLDSKDNRVMNNNNVVRRNRIIHIVRARACHLVAVL